MLSITIDMLGPSTGHSIFKITPRWTQLDPHAQPQPPFTALLPYMMTKKLI